MYDRRYFSKIPQREYEKVGRAPLTITRSRMGTLPTAGYCKGSPCNEKRNLISMNWIFCAKLVNRMKQESVRLLLHPIHLH